MSLEKPKNHWPLRDVPEYREIIEAICSYFDIPLSERDPKESWQWNGNNMAVGIDWSMSMSDLLHEVAHWLVCDEERRVEKDFGLGIGPKSGLASDLLVKQDIEEEIKASALGMFFERALGMNWRYTAAAHQWSFTASEVADLWFIYKECKAKGILTHGAIPKVIKDLGYR